MIFSYMPTGMGSRTTSTDEMLETENNRMVDDLAAKVSRLKGVSGQSSISQKNVVYLWIQRVPSVLRFPCLFSQECCF